MLNYISPKFIEKITDNTFLRLLLLVVTIFISLVITSYLSYKSNSFILARIVLPIPLFIFPWSIDISIFYKIILTIPGIIIYVPFISMLNIFEIVSMIYWSPIRKK